MLFDTYASKRKFLELDPIYIICPNGLFVNRERYRVPKTDPQFWLEGFYQFVAMEPILFVGSLFDEYSGLLFLEQKFGKENVHPHGLFYGQMSSRPISTTRSLPRPEEILEEKIVLALVVSDLQLYHPHKTVTQVWSEYRFPILTKKDGVWTVSDTTDEYSKLIDKENWSKCLYMFYKVLTVDYSVDKYEECLESYGASVRENCAFCREEPPNQNNYTKIHGKCSRCRNYACGNHLWQNDKQSEYLCPQCW